MMMRKKPTAEGSLELAKRPPPPPAAVVSTTAATQQLYFQSPYMTPQNEAYYRQSQRTLPLPPLPRPRNLRRFHTDIHLLLAFFHQYRSADFIDPKSPRDEGWKVREL
ncbi:hypothetical protein M422DRAFT_255014 [Sphaerobolus stellatus SS14]|uniref:Uncharacterized protein n=1 Tax=Sphaerobolus stellatus (strain SS14) TaxID=990650 RepID=A0A0C9VK37_SPHS4|nr:hypothetical protein M422DRAFT_255014 [Sphaerobolus stellatus SS14]